MPKVVIIVENLPVPFDRRVWQEAQALRAAGWQVSVICPANEQYPLAEETIDGIHIFRHKLPLEGRGASGFLVEYAAALVHEFRLLLKVQRRHGFDVIQACNPPDLIFLVALPYKLFGKKFVFDHHDICPELYVAKYGKKGLFHRLLVLAERWTFRTADLVISSNHTFRQLAIERGGKRPDDVVAVYSIPDRSRLRRVEADPRIRRGKKLTLGYVGIIGDQDGVDQFVEAVKIIRHNFRFTDFQAIVVGDGPALSSVKDRARELGLGDDAITFTGYLTGEDLLRHLSTFDVGVIPDPVNDYNHKISMNKVFEYGAFGVPTAAYPLTETRRLLGEAGTYARGDRPADLAGAIHELLKEDDARAQKGAAALSQASERFSWDLERERYVEAYSRLLVRGTAAAGGMAESIET